MTKAKSTAVATVSTDTQLPAEFDPALAAMLESDAGAGNDVSIGAMSIPYLSVCQAMSKARDEDAPEYLEGLKEGMIYNNVTGDMWSRDGDLYVIPVVVKEGYTMFNEKDDIIGYMDNKDPRLADASQDGMDKVLPDGTRLGVTHQHYVLTLDSDYAITGFGLMSMRSTQLKPSKEWNSIKNFRRETATLPNGKVIKLPAYAHVYQVKTMKRSNDDGTWSVFKFNHAGVLDIVGNPDHRGVLAEAGDMYKMLKDQAVVPNAVDDPSSVGGEEEIPF